MTGNRTRDRRPDRGDERGPLVASSRSVTERDRGQTTQDFAIGIGIFLLALAFVFLFLPSVVTPFESSVGDAETAQADRIADRIVSNASTETPNEIDDTKFDKFTAADLESELGLRSSDEVRVDKVNVTVWNLEDGTRVETGGDRYDDQPAEMSARIVTFDESIDCEPACRLVVRVW
ncbi:hypothetical protein A6E15_10315 [Natrinema saccharevitans]|uniref:Uncharacterized protein n=1 Tax=Natrinema saccharevitans TaxID=301967 RepID=A0A1S8AWW4_9EURY|nr:hypothetical protein [Natrinema saccharevitans]OLZ41358.1 hypothetical protein A6E15_10315 [Natrinema saccharevitans]